MFSSYSDEVFNFDFSANIFVNVENRMIISANNANISKLIFLQIKTMQPVTDIFFSECREKSFYDYRGILCVVLCVLLFINFILANVFRYYWKEKIEVEQNINVELPPGLTEKNAEDSYE